jgi:hypothetical protein
VRCRREPPDSWEEYAHYHPLAESPKPPRPPPPVGAPPESRQGSAGVLVRYGLVNFLCRVNTTIRPVLCSSLRQSPLLSTRTQTYDMCASLCQKSSLRTMHAPSPPRISNVSHASTFSDATGKPPLWSVSPTAAHRERKWYDDGGAATTAGARGNRAVMCGWQPRG